MHFVGKIIGDSIKDMYKGVYGKDFIFTEYPNGRVNIVESTPIFQPINRGQPFKVRK